MARTINHPGVEIKEIDLSQYADITGGTSSLSIGFASQGEDYLPLEFTSRNSYLSYFGKPTNEAERYLYYSALESIGQNGKTYVAKLPYTNTVSGQFMNSVYTVGTESAMTGATLSAYIDYSVSATNPITKTSDSTITIGVLDTYRTGSAKPAVNTFSIVDTTRQTLRKDNLDQETVGTFVVVNTAYNALPNQDLLVSGVTDWYAVSSATTSAGVDVADVVSPYFTATTADSSISQTTASLFPSVTLTDEGDLDAEFLGQIGVSVVRQYIDSDNNNKINYSVVESFVGSLNPAAINATTGDSIFIDSVINTNSNYVNFFSNVTTNRPADNTSLYSISGIDTGVFGFTEGQMEKKITLSSITTGLDNIFDKMSNIDATEIDQVVDAGITTIGQYLTTTGDNAVYDPTSTVTSGWVIDGRADTATWRSIAQKYIKFAQNTRQDCMALIDVPRNLSLEGNQKIVRPSAPSNSIDLNIIPKLKYMTGLNSSYSATYTQWLSRLDDFTGTQMWMPPSVVANGIYIYTDRTAGYWYAPAGLNRGIVYSANDISFNPNGKQQDSLFTKNFDYFINSPIDGIALMGDKTNLTKDTAFNSINVRRMFLRVERFTRRAARYFVMEPNNSITRQRFIDTITPIYTGLQTDGGIQEFKIVCDSSNNTPDVVDRSEMVCSILIKPTKSVRYMLLTFVATSQGASLEEIVV